MKLAGPQLVQMYIGDGAKLVRDAFDLAKVSSFYERNAGWNSNSFGTYREVMRFGIAITVMVFSNPSDFNHWKANSRGQSPTAMLSFLPKLVYLIPVRTCAYYRDVPCLTLHGHHVKSNQ